MLMFNYLRVFLRGTILASFILASCSDYGERDNPYDPTAANYNASLFSSPAISSSSSEFIKIVWTYQNPNINYGVITDKRDNQMYRTVKISSKVWLAENMNYGQLGICYEEDDELCDKYGRLYTWKDAASACPEGFHLPSKAEWNALGSDVSLMSMKGWALDSGKVGGSDDLGISLLPAGFASVNSDDDVLYEGISTDAMLWTSTELVSDSAYGIHVFDMQKITVRNAKKKSYLSVRCVQ